ncbi:MAG: tail fiber domain-containing protein [Acidobacteria bacterium]|nr:tail fiber domain-containing protein [Acidobacteriota bacterium]
MKKLIIATILINLFAVCSLAQTTEFSYQGILKTSSAPANGNFDFEFRLFDAASGGTQQGSTVIKPNIAVVNGVYAVTLDFGAAPLTGANRFLSIAVRSAGGAAYTTLEPRQAITSSPYAVRSLNATTADTATNATNATTANNALNLGGVAANQYVVTTDPRMTDARTPTAGSANYIQNGTSTQSASNFNISGNGTASGTLSSNIINATTQYNLGGSRILRSPGTGNLFAGFSAGVATTGLSNSFFGTSAGQSTTTGEQNSFFGNATGLLNVTGSFNSYFGRSAGLNSTASNNSFFGYNAGALNTGGNSNSFFGRSAGEANTGGNSNAFFGRGAGIANTDGSLNAFFGTFAGSSNTTGSNNTAIGDGANFSVGNLTFATAIGAGALVTASNTIVLGRPVLDDVYVGGFLSVGNSIGAGNSAACFAPTPNPGSFIVICASSIRYKTNVAPLLSGLKLIQRLRPVTFDWKERFETDLGLIAEEVAEVEPLLVTYTEKGEIQGVKYKQIAVVLINAVKEQQAQIEVQQKLIEQQQRQIDALKKLVCAQNPTADVCKEEK